MVTTFVRREFTGVVVVVTFADETTLEGVEVRDGDEVSLVLLLLPLVPSVHGADERVPLREGQRLLSHKILLTQRAFGMVNCNER